MHELRIDVALHPGKLFAKPLELNREDFSNGEVEAVLKVYREPLRWLLGRDRNLEPLDGNFELRGLRWRIIKSV